MFKNCKLTTTSLENIAKHIKDVNDIPDTTKDKDGNDIIKDDDGNDVVAKTIHIGLADPTNTGNSKHLNDIVDKGWTVFVNTQPDGKGDYVEYVKQTS